MDGTPSPTHRTVAIVGGAGSGKTTLAEALLFRAGAVQRRGAVEQGTTVCDHDPEEIARQTTLGISLAYSELERGRRGLIAGSRSSTPRATLISWAASTPRSPSRMSR